MVVGANPVRSDYGSQCSQKRLEHMAAGKHASEDEVLHAAAGTTSQTVQNLIAHGVQLLMP
jgi:hypothetical protein